MSLNITSITINTADLEPMLSFYSGLGLCFEQVKVSKGSSVHKSQVNGIEFSIFEITQVARKSAPSLQLSFQVCDVKEMVTKLLTIPHVMCVLDPIELEGTMKAIMIDPDGHSVELIES